jgi:hypothetical protein
VNPKGLNLYRLYVGPVSQLAALIAAKPPDLITNFPIGDSASDWFIGDDGIAAGLTVGAKGPMISHFVDAQNLYSSNPPIFITNLSLLNGHAGYLFTNRTWCYNSNYVTDPQDYSMFIVYRTLTNASPQVIAEFQNPFDILAAYPVTPAFRAGFASTDVLYAPANSSGWNLAEAIKVGDQLYAWCNGRGGNGGNPIDRLSVEVGLPMYHPLYIGGAVQGNGTDIPNMTQFFTGYIAELIFYDHAVNFGYRAQVEAFLKWKYGL